MKISVQVGEGKALTIEIDEHSTVAAAKLEAAKHASLPSDADLRLLFAGETLVDSSTLKENGIVEGSQVYLHSLGSTKEEIHIQMLTGQKLTIGLDRGETVNSLKEKIATASSIPVDQHRLIFAGKTLEDGHPLAEYNIQRQSTLHLVLRMRMFMAQSGRNDYEAPPPPRK
jgi:ubiquitin C